ncbi:uncharacterized protein LOC124119746 [Haliotis rufescens]|uniref:uncharacterized protein LOC124119746 n=1 Tax=Haliotis rufescens TaxID=6454 RepID=UPI001EB0532E|nr:uncharacterized protein LOC124119746 [Haliotis rufescens]
MLAKLITGCVVMTLFSMATAQTTGMTTCQQTFLQRLYACVGSSNMDVNNFLWLVTNRTNGQAPNNTDPNTFKKQACGQEEALVKCGIEFMRELINASMCNSSPTQSEDQRPLIDRQFRALFGSFDQICAHPCRQTLTTDLRNCYTESNLDPDLFLSNSTMGRGAVIGTTDDQAQTFCKNKDALVMCMKKRRDDCPESPIVLRAIGLDIDSMEKGVGVLCKHTDLYLVGIDCFAEQTESVMQCLQKQTQDTVQLMLASQQENLEEQQFMDRFCQIRVDHVGCDLDAWGQKKHKSCSPAVMGLRTELECNLLPDVCKERLKSTVDKICHVDNFNRDKRLGGGATSAYVSMATLPFVLMAAILNY